MKSIIRILALATVFTTLALTLISCAPTLSGVYESDGLLSDGVLSFGGSKVTYTKKSVVGTAKVYEGKYSLNEDTGTITFDFEDEECPLKGSYDFSQNKEEGTVKIGIVTYTKK